MKYERHFEYMVTYVDNDSKHWLKTVWFNYLKDARLFVKNIKQYSIDKVWYRKPNEDEPKMINIIDTFEDVY